jgi:hypothetical protein
MPAPAAIEPAAPQFMERHFSVAELAAIWNLSHETVRVTFISEPGVLRIQHGKHITMRIPQSIAEKVYRRLQERR